MKLKLIFLVKVLLCSIGLYAIWSPISQGYEFILKELMTLFTTPRDLLNNILAYLSITSRWMIPFFSLMIATPNIPIMKRAEVTGIGIAVFFIIDCIFILYVVNLRNRINIDLQTVDCLHQCLKLLASLMLWIIANPTFLISQVE